MFGGLGCETAAVQSRPPPAIQVYASSKPARLMQTPGLTIVSRFGHVVSCSMLDHGHHAALEKLSELTGRWGDGLGHVRAHGCLCVADGFASSTIGHFGLSEFEMSVACKNRCHPRWSGDAL